jgi:hypothetical protein
MQDRLGSSISLIMTRTYTSLPLVLTPAADFASAAAAKGGIIST